jgi:hypothetical protein
MCIFCGSQCGGIGDALYPVIIGLLFKARYWLRARSKITSHFDAPIHHAWLRCSSVK